MIVNIPPEKMPRQVDVDVLAVDLVRELRRKFKLALKVPESASINSAGFWDSISAPKPFREATLKEIQIMSMLDKIMHSAHVLDLEQT